ncbi:MAG: 3-methyl-2-oxobutanoate hydroxymethyltransferase [Deltaproteobacteria bacterium]|nr:3-methyl-2-oxobutanoate hydroxymethyltransferase [Deltaproteobacteria bacterium]MBW2305817.1 3-methyl-2-oxobutanoate hydroxymethyltransferase [Deltaproteobacteria bacterium]
MNAKRVTVTDITGMKQEGRKISMLTAYDYPTARIVDEEGIDIILVGDSLSMVIQGNENSLPVTMDEMVYHTRLVARGARRAMVVGDMPFMSYQASVDKAILNAGRFLKEGGAQVVKLEGGAGVAKTIEALTGAEIPVMAHIGLTPQAIHRMGGFKIQRDDERLISDARAVEEAGAFSVILEGIPGSIAAKITSTLRIPTIGIGAGVHCDGQVLVLHDIIGLFERFTPKFVKRYAELGKEVARAVASFRQDVLEGKFPGPEHTF